MSDLDTLFKNRNFPPFAFGQDATEENAVFENYENIGKLIYAWASGAEAWPPSMAEFRHAVGNDLFVPPEYKRLRIVQADNPWILSEDGDDGLEFVLRLPPKDQVMESASRVDQGITNYPLPPLYTDYLVDGHGIPAKSVLFARIADYTMRSCR